MSLGSASTALRRAARWTVLVAPAALIAIAFMPCHALGLGFTEIRQIPEQHWDFGQPVDSALDSSGTLWVNVGTGVVQYDQQGHLVGAKKGIGGYLVADASGMWMTGVDGITEYDRNFDVMRSIPTTYPGPLPTYPLDIAVDKQGNVYAADGGRSEIRVYGPNGDVVREIPVEGPLAVSVDASGRIFALSSLGRVLRFSAEGAEETSFTCSNDPTQLGALRDIAIADDGTVLVTEPSAIWHYSSDGAFLGVFATDPVPQSWFAGELHAGPKGTYCWSEWNDGGVNLLDHTGNVVQTVGAKFSHVDRFSTLTGIAFDSKGFGYAADSAMNVFKFDASGSVDSSFTLPPKDSIWDNIAQGGIAIDASGDIYSASHAGEILRNAADGTPKASIPATLSDIDRYGGGVAFGPDGHMYATVDQNVVKFDARFRMQQVWSACDPSNYVYNQPLAISRAGEIVVGQQAIKRMVRRYTLDGTYVGGFSLHDSTPVYEQITALAVAPDGTVFVADAPNARVQYFTPAGQYLGDVPTDWMHPFSKPQALAFDPSGRLWVGDANQLRCFSVTGLGTSQYWVDPNAPVAVRVGTPSMSASVKKSRTFKVTGTFSPTQTKGTHCAKLYFFHMEKGHWVRRVTGWATSTGSGYYAKIKLTSRGRWYVRAYHPADSRTLSYLSGCRNFKVK